MFAVLKKVVLLPRKTQSGNLEQRDKVPDERSQAEIAQLVEHDLAKVGVASSSLVFRSKARRNSWSSESRSKGSLIMPSREQECRFAKRSGNSSVGRARPCQGRGREFESRFPLHKVPSQFGIFCVSA